MQHFDIFFITVSLLAFMYILLSINVIMNRRQTHVLYGTGGNIHLQSAMRAHGNFIEYVPITFILFAGLIYCNVPVWLFALLNLVFIFARLSHSLGVIKYERCEPPVLKPRIFGMMGTFLVMLFSIVYIVINITFY